MYIYIYIYIYVLYVYIYIRKHTCLYVCMCIISVISAHKNSYIYI